MAVAVMALFVALAGTGYAVSRIDGRQLKDASVSGKKLRRNTLGGREIRESVLGKVRSAKRADNAVHATSADRSTLTAVAQRAISADTALALSDGAAAGLAMARSGADADNTCHPLNTVDKPFLDCASVTMTLPRPGHVLLVGTGAVGNATTSVPFVAGCQLQVDGTGIAGSLAHAGMDFDTTPGMHFAETPFGIATTVVTDVVAAGAHTFSFACQQSDPDAVVVDAKISAVMVGAS
jgi:hypothetical protein